MLYRDEKSTSCEVSGDVTVKSAELENGARISVLNPSTTVEALTTPNLIRCRLPLEGCEFVAGIGPKTVEGGGVKICGDDIYLAWSEIPVASGRALFVLVDQYDGLSSGEQDNVNLWRSSVRAGKYSYDRLPERYKMYGPAMDTIHQFSDADVRMDADALAVVTQRGFYDLDNAGSVFPSWCSHLDARLVEAINKTPPQYLQLVLKDLLADATRQLVHGRSVYGSDFERAIAAIDYSLHPAEYDRRETSPHWGDSIFTTGLYVIYSDTDSLGEKVVVADLTRSLADSHIVWTMSNKGTAVWDGLCVDANREFDAIWQDVRDTAFTTPVGRSTYYTNLVYNYGKIGAIYASRNHPYNRRDWKVARGGPNSSTLALCQNNSLSYNLCSGDSLCFYHMSDGAYQHTREFKRKLPGLDNLLSEAERFTSNPGDYLVGKVESKPADDWVMGSLVVSG